MQIDDSQRDADSSSADASFAVSSSYFSSGQRHELAIDQYCAGVLAGDFTVLARALTLIESSSPKHQQTADELLAALLPHTGGAIRIGITGVPGVGKSTFIEAFGMHLIRHGKKVAVLAVDPTSGVSGGSILGDKTRMSRLATEPNAYIRPSPSAGTTGGVARKTRECMLVCEAAGYDVVLIETVGVGQSETMVANITDCFVGLMLPGAGDELQAIKRGLLELVDLIVVNKADGPNLAAAMTAAQQYALVLNSLAGREAESPAVLTCSALEGSGVDQVWSMIEQRYTKLKSAGQLTERRHHQNIRWLWSTVDDRLAQAVRTHPVVHQLQRELETKVRNGEITPESAARQILAAFGVS